MYETYASLSRRMNTAKKEYDALLKERRTVIMEHDFEIGTHSVPEGEVIVTVGPGSVKRTIFRPVDEKTQKFAKKYATYSVDMSDAMAEIAAIRARYSTLQTERDECYHDSCCRLVEGIYTIDGGTVTLTKFGVKFRENS